MISVTTRYFKFVNTIKKNCLYWFASFLILFALQRVWNYSTFQFSKICQEDNIQNKLYIMLKYVIIARQYFTSIIYFA